MEKTFNPAIVVVAYNRPCSLLRLLSSLKHIKIDGEAPLIISIDNDEPNNLEVKDIAEKYTWPYGSKKVKYQERHIGLREHVLQCGDYASEFGSVIILEDDLFVSPFFYEYAIHALEYYNGDNQIGGISLYNQPVQNIVEYPFKALYDNSDVYFMQFPSSLGQAWTNTHWKEFRDWYASEPDLNRINIPAKILGWPKSSWKKYFCAFLLEKNKFFVFPHFQLQPILMIRAPI